MLCENRFWQQWQHNALKIENGNINLLFRPVSAKLHDRDVVFKHAAVAADNVQCSKVGSDVLKDGGSAVDAAIASLLCLGELTVNLFHLEETSSSCLKINFVIREKQQLHLNEIFFYQVKL